MTIKEEKRDLFTMPSDYALTHCISADFALGAGIAKEFNKRFMESQRGSQVYDEDYTGNEGLSF